MTESLTIGIHAAQELAKQRGYFARMNGDWLVFYQGDEGCRATWVRIGATPMDNQDRISRYQFEKICKVQT